MVGVGLDAPGVDGRRAGAGASHHGVRIPGAPSGACEGDRARRGVHRVLVRAGAAQRRRRLAVPAGGQPPLSHGHERARDDARPASRRTRSPGNHLRQRSRPVERTLDGEDCVPRRSRRRDRRARRALASTVQRLPRCAVPGRQLRGRTRAGRIPSRRRRCRRFLRRCARAAPKSGCVLADRSTPGRPTREQQFRRGTAAPLPGGPVPRCVLAAPDDAGDQERGRAGVDSAGSRRHGRGAEGRHGTRQDRNAREPGRGYRGLHVPESRRLLLGIPLDCRRRQEHDDASLRDQQRSDRAGRPAPDRSRRRSRGLLGATSPARIRPTARSRPNSGQSTTPCWRPSRRASS